MEIGKILELLEEEEDLHLGSVGQMFAQVTGIVLQLTVVHITLLAVQAASSVVPSRMTLLGAITVTSHAQEVLVAVGDLDGNLATGYVTGD